MIYLNYIYLFILCKKGLCKRCFFILSQAWDKEKILSPCKESNLRPMVWCSNVPPLSQSIIQTEGKVQVHKSILLLLGTIVYLQECFFYQYKWRINKNVLLCLWFPVRAAYIHIMNHHLTVIPGVSVQFFKDHTMKSCSQLYMYICMQSNTSHHLLSRVVNGLLEKYISQVCQTLFFPDFHLRFCIFFLSLTLIS